MLKRSFQSSWYVASERVGINEQICSDALCNGEPSPSELRNPDAFDNDHRTTGNTESRSHSRGRNLGEMEDGLSAPRLQTYCDATTSFRAKDTPAATGRGT